MTATQQHEIDTYLDRIHTVLMKLPLLHDASERSMAIRFINCTRATLLYTYGYTIDINTEVLT